MKKISLYIVVICFVIVCFIAFSSFTGGDAHLFKGECDSCHLGMKNPEILIFEPDRLCTKCHKNQTERSHPSNLFPKKKVPKIFPLYKGKMVCTSCHFAHHKFGNGKGKKGADINPYLLRYKVDGKEFCFQCHKGDFSGAADDAHALSMTKAHMSENIASLKGIIDDNSRDCLSCHDGTLSSSAGVSMSGKGMNWEHTVGMSHPIGVSYEDAYRKKPGEYKNINMLDKRIKLFNGKIGCETCHDHYSKEKHRLVMDNYRSRLCLSCHDL